MSSKKRVITLTGTALLLSASAYAGNVGVDLNLHLGDRPRQTVVREVVTAPVQPQVVIEDDVDFIYPDTLGFYVAVGVPYDLVLIRNNYYVYRDGAWWCRGRDHRGPWRVVERGALPPGLRRYKVDRIRHYRDREYDVYRRDHDHYRGRHMRLAKDEWKERRKEEKERMKEERREEKERWKEERREEKEERKRGHGRGHDRD